MYHLEILNDKEFEELTKDLLEREFNIPFQNFKRGKDKGIDLRYSTDRENKIVVQVKHYINSKYSDLKRSLAHDEKPKVEKLQPVPVRYILVTSLALNTMQVDEIKSLFSPFIKSTNDIFSFDRIQSLLSKYPDVVEKHNKLWLASTVILKRILNNAVKGRSQFHESKILSKLSLYVPTQNFDAAVKILNEKKFVIITGDPGVGKTTISYLLICSLLSQDFNLVYVDDSLKDAEDVLSDDPEEKQVIFFDDFLGSNIYEILNPKNSESAIIGFIERIKTLKNKFLILTTRTTILNQAEHNFEKLRQSKLGRISQYEVELKQYSKLDKARILYNHLYHSDLPTEYHDLFWQDRNYIKIIEHRNYSPRLIEFITSSRHLPKTKTDYINHIFQNLNYPNEIWKGAFETQLVDDDRFLLTTVLSLGGYKIKQEHLERAFEHRLRFEIKENGHKLNNDAFNTSLRKLLDGFIVSEKNNHDSNTFSFLNPSVGDFLISYIKERSAEKMRILKSFHYVEQLTNYFSPARKDSIPITPKEAKELYTYILTKAPDFETVNINCSLEVEILRLYSHFLKDQFDTKELIPYLSKFDATKVSNGQLDDLMAILEKYSSDKKIRKIILPRFDKTVSALYQVARASEEFHAIKCLFVSYEQDFNVFMSNEYNSEVIFAAVAVAVTDDFIDNARYSAETIIDTVSQGFSSLARSIVSDSLNDRLSDFLDEIEMADYFEEIFENIDINEDEIVEEIMRSAYVEQEEFDPPSSYFSDNKLPNSRYLFRTSKAQGTNQHQSESERIDKLFEP
ncbi:restriction endonuclease [Imperialibacter roseus]|uniref:Restriction endonuclease n=1 Tax=Imperialibacter roseus TaxID=1324217 RepID=A0ABZ0IRG1_9BACT|nr:restriction endonuclease [Imperialibacter roseus]WOK06565.1 restriction endonuclease [Imperialibacter roseus]